MSDDMEMVMDDGLIFGQLLLCYMTHYDHQAR